MENSNNPLIADSAVNQDLQNLIDFFAAIPPDYDAEKRVNRFQEEYTEAFDLIQRYPEGYGFKSNLVRRFRLKKSRCLVLYLALPKQTVILAVVHEAMDSLDYFVKVTERLNKYVPKLEE